MDWDSPSQPLWKSAKNSNLGKYYSRVLLDFSKKHFIRLNHLDSSLYVFPNWNKKFLDNFICYQKSEFKIFLNVNKDWQPFLLCNKDHVRISSESNSPKNIFLNKQLSFVIHQFLKRKKNLQAKRVPQVVKVLCISTISIMNEWKN